MKKSIKIISILLMALLLVSFFTSNVLAATGVLNKIEQAYNEAEVNMDSVMPTVGKIIKYIRNFSIIAAVIIIIILGVMYMMGSVQQKSEYQKHFIPLAVGIILVVSATSIASMLFSIMA